jgi:hypothetical protein
VGPYSDPAGLGVIAGTVTIVARRGMFLRERKVVLAGRSGKCSGIAAACG